MFSRGGRWYVCGSAADAAPRGERGSAQLRVAFPLFWRHCRGERAATTTVVAALRGDGKMAQFDSSRSSTRSSLNKCVPGNGWDWSASTKWHRFEIDAINLPRGDQFGMDDVQDISEATENRRVIFANITPHAIRLGRYQGFGESVAAPNGRAGGAP